MKKIINMDTIVQDPNPILREKCELVTFPMSTEDKNTLLDMIEYVEKSQDDEIAEQENLQAAVGIAAPQIGINKQMCAIVVHDIDKDGEEVVYKYGLVNPKIVVYSVKECALGSGEACLSIRDEHQGIVPRAMRIKVKAYDLLQEKDIEINARDYFAIVLQHEIDHLNGILFYDHINEKDPFSYDPALKIID